jgi:predicted enzyme related to lactoylglutathione lyase
MMAGMALAAMAALGSGAAAEEKRTMERPARTALGTRTPDIILYKFTVTDLGKSYDFYTKVVGLKMANAPGRPPMQIPSADMVEQQGYAEIPLNFTGSLADPFFVVYQQRGARPNPDTARLSIVGFKVADVRAAIRRVKEAGYEVVREPGDVMGSGVSVGFARDPDGYTIEFIQAADNPAR